MLALEDARCQAVDKVAIVRHEQHRPGEAADRFEQHILRAQVEVVRRLVQQDEIRRTHQHACQRITIALAAAQHAKCLEHIIAREEECAEQVAQLSRRNLRRRAADVFQHLCVWIEHFVLVLREIVGQHIVAVADSAFGRIFHLRQHADQRRFARAVRAHQRDAVTTLDGEVYVLQDLLRLVPFGKAADLAHQTSARRRLREGEMDRLLIFRHFDALDLVEFLDAALHLLGLGGLVAKAIDEGLKLLDAVALARVVLCKLFAPFGLLLDVFLVAARVKPHALVPHLDDLADRHIEEVAIVRDEDERARIAAQVILQPVARFEIKVVRRLVQQQQRWLLKQQLGQRNAHLPSATELIGLPGPVVLAEAEPAEHRPHLRIQVVEIVLLQRVAYQAEAVRNHRILRTVRRKVRKLIAERVHLLVHRQRFVKDRQALLEDGLAAHHQAVLRQVADGQPLAAIELSAVQLLDARKHLQQRALARAVAADEAGALIRRDQPVGAFKQQFVSEALGSIGKVQHASIFALGRMRLRCCYDSSLYKPLPSCIA